MSRGIEKGHMSSFIESREQIDEDKDFPLLGKPQKLKQNLSISIMASHLQDGLSSRELPER